MTNQEAFHELMANLKRDPEKLALFYQTPTVFLEEAGIPVFEKPSDVPGGIEKPAIKTPVKAMAATSGFHVITHWWGLTFVMDENITNKIAIGEAGLASLGPIIAAGLVASGSVTGPVGSLISASFAAAFALKATEIKLIDGGKGVYWPITWPQWGLVLVNATMPPMLVTTIATFIHPLPN
jgi:hypothetical protein